jgi:GNAT superfamily N-acetyltransferase
MHLRPARPGDEPALAALNQVVQSVHVAARPDHFHATDARTVEVTAWFAKVLRSEQFLVWLAEEDGEPIGYTLTTFHEREANPFCPAQLWFEIDQIAVAEGYRGRGVARALIEAAVREARARGVTRVELQTWAFNERAVAAFSRLGFVPKVVRFELPGGALRAG